MTQLTSTLSKVRTLTEQRQEMNHKPEINFTLQCGKDVASFFVMFAIVFLAFAQLGNLLFGTQGPNSIQNLARDSFHQEKVENWAD